MPPFSYAFPLPAVSIPIANMDGTPSWDILFIAQAGIAICFLQQTHRRFLWTCQRDFNDPFSFACQAIQEAVRGSSSLNIFFPIPEIYRSRFVILIVQTGETALRL